jgi:ribosomal protein S3
MSHADLFSTRELAEEGYSGCEVRVTHARTEIIIRATHTQEVLGHQGRRIRELKALVEKRFKFPENSLELYAEKVQFRGLSAVAQAESLRYKLLGGLAMRRYVLSSRVNGRRCRRCRCVVGSGSCGPFNLNRIRTRVVPPVPRSPD